jgi:hypothetical protein
MRERRKRKSCWDRSPEKIEAAQRRLRESKGMLGHPERVLQRLRQGETIEVNNNGRGTIVQVRRRWNKMPTEDDLALLARWGDAGGPQLAYWLPV